MSFFEGLERFARDVDRFFKGKPEALKLKSCTACVYYKRGYCTQTSPPTKVLSEYYAQGCIFYTTEQPVQEPTPTPKPVSTVEEIKKLIELSTMRDVILPQPSLILNPFFEQELAGWNDSYGNITVKSDGAKPRTMYAFFPDYGECVLDQKFGIPISVNWLTEFYLWIYSTHVSQDLLQVKYEYTDETNSTQVLQRTTGLWSKKVLTPTAGKYINQLEFHHGVLYRDCGISYINTVF